MKWIIITNLPDPDHNIVLRVADGNFIRALLIAKQEVVAIKYDDEYDLEYSDLAWDLDSAITDEFGKYGIKYERHSSIPKRSTEEVDEACDEYWIFFDQIDSEGEQ